MRAEVRKSMERELADVIRGRVRVQALDALYKDNPVDVPRALIDEQVQQLQIDTARRLGIREASQLPRARCSRSRRAGAWRSACWSRRSCRRRP